jgi:glycosyltransferase involved in cell wall biosynthesis
MIIDSIDIGGAETHLINLVKMLKDQGVTPIVVSSGGIYEAVLDDYDITHYETMINSKSPMALIKSIRLVNNIITKEAIDIVHSHGRMPAFIGNISATLTQTKFMTTAHAKVEAKSLYKYFTTYGDRVISVSQDIKNHIIEKFNVQEDIIDIIPNGINTDVFKEQPYQQALGHQLNLNPTSIKILVVSRMDGPLGAIAIDLIKIFQENDYQPENLELLVVGSGDRLDEIQQISKGMDAVKVLGKRTDIDAILSLSTIVVAVSRSALEAFSSKKLVILAGGEGFWGLFTPEKYQLAESDNFTGRNSQLEYSKSRLAEAIDKAIALLGTNEAEEIKAFERQMVINHYSLQQSVNETIKIYQDFRGGNNA